MHERLVATQRRVRRKRVKPLAPAVWAPMLLHRWRRRAARRDHVWPCGASQSSDQRPVGRRASNFFTQEKHDPQKRNPYDPRSNYRQPSDTTDARADFGSPLSGSMPAHASEASRFSCQLPDIAECHRGTKPASEGMPMDLHRLAIEQSQSPTPPPTRDRADTDKD